MLLNFLCIYLKRIHRVLNGVAVCSYIPSGVSGRSVNLFPASHSKHFFVVLYVMLLEVIRKCWPLVRWLREWTYDMGGVSWSPAQLMLKPHWCE